MKIYTRQGDAGETGLFDGRRVAKDDLRIETYGTVDELNSVVGVAIAGCRQEELRGKLEKLQHQLFDVGSDLATPLGKKEEKIQRVSGEDVKRLEEEIDAATAVLPALKRFILPGGSTTAGQLHVARTVCRRAERLAVRLARTEEIGVMPVMYLNRLSDLLFMWARWANFLEGRGDVEWESGKR